MAYRRPDPVAESWDWRALHAVALREARAVLRDDHAAQDAAQEAALRAWRHAAACRTPGAPDTWLRTIARREALRLIRPCALGLDGDRAMESAAGPEDERVVLRADVGRAVACLSDRERVVVEQHYWHDRSCAQIAEALELPVGTVKIRLHRARHKLRAHL